MSDYPGTGRLEPELLAAYIDGELPPEARAKVEAEIAADPENYEWLVNVMAAVDAESIPGGGTKATDHGEAHNEGQVEPWPLPTPVPEPEPKPDGGGTKKSEKIVPFYRQRSVMGAIGALTVAASVMLVVQLQPNWDEFARGPETGFEKLVEAVGREQYIGARLSGGFKSGPPRPVTRGATNRSRDNLLLLAAAKELQQAVDANATDGSLHAFGAAQLLLGNSREALEILQPLAKKVGSAPVYSDLAAAYIGVAQDGGSGEMWPSALKAAQRACEIDPRFTPALFNRALALEGLGFTDRAEEAWASYFALERDSGWKATAKALRQTSK